MRERKTAKRKKVVVTAQAKIYPLVRLESWRKTKRSDTRKRRV